MKSNVTKRDDVKGIIVGYRHDICWGNYKMILNGERIDYEHVDNIKFLFQERSNNIGKKTGKETITERIDNLIEVIKQLHNIDSLGQNANKSSLSYTQVVEKKAKDFVYRYLKDSKYKNEFYSNVEESLFGNEKFSTLQLKKDYKNMDAIEFLNEYKINCQKHESYSIADEKDSKPLAKVIGKVQDILVIQPLNKLEQFIEKPLGYLADKIWLKGSQQAEQDSNDSPVNKQ